MAYSLLVIKGVPCAYSDAIQVIENLKWKKAKDEEIESLNRNQTWEYNYLKERR